MAIFYLQISSLSRGAGRRATAAAAYRAGARIRDERSGELINYSRRRDVLHSEILLPGSAGGSEWARDRSRLWNAAEAAEKRRNSLVAREFTVALPAELNASQRTALAQSFAREIAERYSIAVDLAVHAPREAGDARNHHAHLLATTRVITADGLGAKAGLDRYEARDWSTTIEGRRTEYRLLRARWAGLTNDALAAANVATRIDPRSLAEQGLNREPNPRLSMIAVQMERRGQPSAAAERVRADWRARVAARDAAGPAGVSLELPAQEEHGRATGASAQAGGASGLEEVRRQARQAWLHMREGMRQVTQASAREPAAQLRGREAEVEQARDPVRSDEFSR